MTPRHRHPLLATALLASGVIPLLVTGTVVAQNGLFDAPGAKRPDIVMVSAQFVPGPDDVGTLFVTAKIADGWHIYSLTQRKGGPHASKLVIPFSKQYSIRGPIKPWPKPHIAKEEVWKDLPIESHEGEVTWFTPIAFPTGADLKTLKIEGSLKAQACNAEGCLPPKNFSFTATLGEGVKLPPEAAKFDAATEAPVQPAPATSQSSATPDGNAPQDTSTAGTTPPVADPFDSQSLEIEGDDDLSAMPLGLAMLFAFAGGLLLNLMPCVLPVIGLKILSFVQQSGQSRGHVLALNIWYSLGLISVFMLLASLAAFAGFGWGQLFAYSQFNIAMAAIVFAMSLSFLGVWEIPIPGFVGGGKASELASKEGPAGAFSKGAITTILATPCTGPFLTSALVWAATQPPLMVYTVFFSIGLGMSSPYLLIGAFPHLVRWLPKPGPWMETFKQLMGFVLLGTVVYLLMLLSPAILIPTIALLFGIWAGCWWIGRHQWSLNSTPKWISWITGAGLAAAIGVFAFTWLRDVSEHRFVERVDDYYAQQRLAPTKAVAGSDGRLPWKNFSRTFLSQLAQENKTVMVDFTADWCLTCKTLEATVLNSESVREFVKKNRIVTLKADWDSEKPAYEDTDWMLKKLNGKQIPIVAIFPAGRPTKPIVLRGLYPPQKLLDALAKAGPSKPAAGATTAMGETVPAR